MRNSFIVGAVLVAILLILIGFAFFYPVSGSPSASPTSFALVELFTSEGCSSCPPADAALSRICEEYKSGVFVLGFHVDYWDRLGWKDRYSNADYTKRQQEYAKGFQLNSIYTPQVIVNGRIQFVGSDEAQLRKTIEEELKNPPGSPIEARAIIEPAGEINVSYQVRPHHEELLQVALIQLHAKSHVLKGENQGRLLEHVDLVRDFRTIKVDPGKTNQGSLILALPQGLTSADCRIIAFLQEKQSRHIIGAVEIPL